MTLKEDIDPSYWTEFLEQPGVKPIVVLQYSRHMNTESLLDRLSKAFSSAVVPNAFKIVFPYVDEPLTEFRETNKISGEILELKKGLPTDCESVAEDSDENLCYTLERSSF
ncbi:hypothetical protein Ddc_23244 [Ditylenchus destructor]|nr:hypothetical protein Ddc_23244 [Ditylenchus destructor]